MNDNEKYLKDLLVAFENEHILNDVILIGSWCLLFYKHIFESYEPSVRTIDVDFYVPNVKSIRTKNGLVDTLKELNYDVVNDVLTHKTTFISPDGFELEFLTKLQRNNLSCVKLGNTNVYAETLSYLDVFLEKYIEIDYYGLKVKVASPISFVLQKLLINDIRKDKKEKDIQAIKEVLFYVKVSGKFSEELEEQFNELPKKWKKRILSNAEANKIYLFDKNNKY